MFAISVMKNNKRKYISRISTYYKSLSLVDDIKQASVCKMKDDAISLANIAKAIDSAYVYEPVEVGM